jgi:hypothetical protein
VQQHLAQFGLSAVQACGEPEALGEDLGGLVEADGELVEPGAERVEGVLTAAWKSSSLLWKWL